MFSGYNSHASYLSGVVFVQLSLSAITAPETQNARLGRVCHVDQPFEPPPLNDRSVDRSQH